MPTFIYMENQTYGSIFPVFRLHEEHSWSSQSDLQRYGSRDDYKHFEKKKKLNGQMGKQHMRPSKKQMGMRPEMKKQFNQGRGTRQKLGKKK